MDRSKLPFRKNCEGYFVLGDSIVCRDSHLGYIDFPGGGVEENEDIEGALRREIMEEAGAILDKKMTEIATLKTVWPMDWAKNEKQKKRFEKYQGDDMHFFIGKVKELVTPTGDPEENGWDINERTIKIRDVIKMMERYRPFPKELRDYYELKLKILKSLI